MLRASGGALGRLDPRQQLGQRQLGQRCEPHTRRLKGQRLRHTIRHDNTIDAGARRGQRTIRRVLERQRFMPLYAERVKRRAERLKAPRIACLGLAYKPDIDDLRESPAVEVVQLLAREPGYELRVVEPNLHSHPQFALTSLASALDGADIVLILVAHRQFKAIPRHLLAEKIIVDTCGALR